MPIRSNGSPTLLAFVVPSKRCCIICVGALHRRGSAFLSLQKNHRPIGELVGEREGVANKSSKKRRTILGPRNVSQAKDEECCEQNFGKNHLHSIGPFAGGQQFVATIILLLWVLLTRVGLVPSSHTCACVRCQIMIDRALIRRGRAAAVVNEEEKQSRALRHLSASDVSSNSGPNISVPVISVPRDTHR